MMNSRKLLKSLTLLAVIFILVTGAGPSRADDEYYLNITLGARAPAGTFFGGDDFLWDWVSTPVNTGPLSGCYRDAEGDCVECGDGDTMRSAVGSGHAYPGSIGLDHTIRTACWSGSIPAYTGAGGSSSFRVDDVVFSSQDEGTISVSLNLDVYGFFSLGCNEGQRGLMVHTPVGPFTASSSGSDDIDTNIPGYVNGATTSFSTWNFTVPLNTPWTLTLGVQTWEWGGPSFCLATTSASVSFPSDGSGAPGSQLALLANAGPVFNVPDGVTVNSVQAGIVDNVWTEDPVASEDMTWGQVKSLYR